MELEHQLLLQNVRNDFPLFDNGRNNIAYLDNASTSQMPAAVLAEMNNYYALSKANIHRGVYKMSEFATQQYEQAHADVARFINASPEEVIFTHGTTESLNALAYTLTKGFKPTDEVVISEMEHHANFVPWQQLAKDRGFKLRFVPFTDDEQLDMQALRSMVTANTKIISLAWVSNALGTIHPLKEIVQIGHSVGAKVIIDAAQAAGHLPIDVKDIDCDFLAFSGHKMLGPTGIGVLYGKKEHLESMDPFLYGGDMIREVTTENSTWNDLPWKFEAGTPAIAEGIGLGAAVRYIEHVGIENIQEYEKELTAYAIDQLSQIGGLRMYGPKDLLNRAGIISFSLLGVHPHDLATLLDRNNIAIRAGHHCAMPLMKKLGVVATSRISFHIYNTKEDIDRLASVISRTQQVFNA